MTTMYGLARLGRPAEVRYTPDGKAVANLALAFNYGRRGDDGNRPTQWVDGALWGERAEKLSEHLTKGRLMFVTLTDVHIETYQGQNGQAHKLVGFVNAIEFAGPAQGEGASAPAPAPRQAPSRAPAAAPRPAPKSNTGFDDMDDDIPFASSCFSFDAAPLDARRMRRYLGV